MMMMRFVRNMGDVRDDDGLGRFDGDVLATCGRV